MTVEDVPMTTRRTCPRSDNVTAAMGSMEIPPTVSHRRLLKVSGVPANEGKDVLSAIARNAAS
jgi:hypothetical protein